MSKNMSLHNARMNKNDEFYTQIADIENELKYYTEYLKDSIIYCNCDNPETSAFWKYFHLHFAELGLKKLISTYYIPQMFVWDIGAEKPFAMIYEGGNDSDISVGDKIQLKGNGDFRSAECINYLKESDIVITNPPFSLFREFVAQLIKYDKKFIIIGNKNAITHKEFFPLLKNDKVWIGYNVPNEFNTPEGITQQVNGLCRWFTNIDIAKRHKKLILCKTYNPEEYPQYDNYDAINVNKVDQIPCDYGGVLGVPITFLDKYNPEQFEIIGIAKRGAGDIALKSKVYTKDDYENYSDLNASPVLFNENGQPYNTYPRILIKRK